MDSVTLSHAADMIIVFGFAGIVGAATGTVVGKLICWAAEKVIEWVKRRRQTKEIEIDEGTASGLGDPEQR